jgi:hypothetical protein
MSNQFLKTCCMLLALSPPVAAATASDNERVITTDEWVTELGHDDYLVREAASEQLVAAGAAAIGPLMRGAASDDTEIAWRSRTILVEIGIAGDEAVLDRVTRAADELARAGHKNFDTLGEQVERWREIRALPREQQMDRLNQYIRGGGDVDPVFFGIFRGC